MNKKEWTKVEKLIDFLMSFVAVDGEQLEYTVTYHGDDGIELRIWAWFPERGESRPSTPLIMWY